MDENNENLVKIIQQRSGFTLNDCETFIMAKNQERNYVDLWSSGGGNFLMTIGLFAVLNFISKVYLHLNNPDAFIKLEHRENIREIRQNLKNLHPEYRREIDQWQLPRVGDTNEIEAFENLIRSLPVNLKNDFIGNQEIDINRIWRAYRNALSHGAWPGGFIAAINYEPRRNITNVNELYDVIRDTGICSFRIQDEQLLCVVDKLTLDVHQITDWICDQIRNDHYTSQNVISTYLWIVTG